MMIIAWGILIPAVVIFVLGLIIAPFYNRDVRDGKYEPSNYYTKEDSRDIFYSYIAILCCVQYIWG